MEALCRRDYQRASQVVSPPGDDVGDYGVTVKLSVVVAVAGPVVAVTTTV